MAFKGLFLFRIGRQFYVRGRVRAAADILSFYFFVVMLRETKRLTEALVNL